MRRGMVSALVVVGSIVLGAVILIALRDPGGQDGPARKLPFITPEGTFDLGIDETSRPISELVEGLGGGMDAGSYRAYTDRGEVQRAQSGTSIHWEDGRARFDDGTALIGLAVEEGGRTGTLMSVAPTVLSSLNITHSLKEPPLTSARAMRVVVLELDGLGWALLQGRAGALPNISGVGNISSALTAFPPRTPTGTAMALTGHDMLHNGILTANDRSLVKETFLELSDASGRRTVWIEGDRSILSSRAELNVDLSGDGSVDDEVLTSLLAHLDGGNDVTLAHFHSIDDEFHAGGSGSARLSDALSRVDSHVGKVMELLGSSTTPSLLVLFSDHGLHDVEGGLGEHGSFLHEDMYAFTAFRVFGASMGDQKPSIAFLRDGEVISVIDEEGLEALPFVEGSYAVRSSRGEVTSFFRGVLVHDLLDMTFGSAAIGSLTFASSDGLSMVIPREWATAGTMTILAYSKDGAPIPEGEGPFRLIVPQELAGEYNGQYCLKDVASMEAVT